MITCYSCCHEFEEDDEDFTHTGRCPFCDEWPDEETAWENHVADSWDSYKAHVKYGE